MKRTTFILSCLLPLMALHAQHHVSSGRYGTGNLSGAAFLKDWQGFKPEMLAPTLSFLTYPSPYTHLEVQRTSFFKLEVDEPAMFHGPVRRVTTIYEIPDTVTAYVPGHGYKAHLLDVLQSKTTDFTFSRKGELQTIAEKYVMHSYFFYRKKYSAKNNFYLRLHKYNKIKYSSPEVQMEELTGEKRWRFKDGKLVSYSHVCSEKNDTLKRMRRKGRTTYYLSGTHIGNDSVRLKYDKKGNLRTTCRFYDGITADERERLRFSYDSLGRMVYTSRKEPYHKQIHAYLYDSTGCVAWVREQVGDSLGVLYKLHYAPQADGTLKVCITWYRILLDGDKADYVSLYKKPDSSLISFFSKRFLNCEERGYARFMDYPKLYETPGEYTFDTAGRLVGYHLQILTWQNDIVGSNCIIRYDTAGRIVEMKALTGTLLFPDGIYRLPDKKILAHEAHYKLIRFAYDDHGQLSEVSWSDGSGEMHTLSIRYTYDERCNWIRRETWRDGRQTGAVRREIEYAEGTF